MEYFEFLHGSRKICLPLIISEKLNWKHPFEKLEETETHRLHLWQYDALPAHPEGQHLPLKQTGTNTIF